MNDKNGAKLFDLRCVLLPPYRCRGSRPKTRLESSIDTFLESGFCNNNIEVIYNTLLSYCFVFNFYSKNVGGHCVKIIGWGTASPSHI